MNYKIYVGVIIYSCLTYPKELLETMIFVASDHKEATAKTEKYAIEFARKTQIKFKTYKIFVQAQHTNHVAHCVHFVRTGFLEDEVQTVENEREFLM